MSANLPIKKIASFSSLALVALVITTSAGAQSETTASPSIGIEVSAPTYRFDIDPAGVAQEIIKVKNTGTTAQVFYPEVLDFRATDESGTPNFITAKESENYTYSLATWISVSKEPINIAPNESVALNFTINVPAKAEPGGRYAGILFGTQPTQPGAGQVAIANKVGSLILVRVSGDAKEVATIKEFSTNATSYQKGPVDFVVRVENGGNVHVVPKGNIEVKNMLGNTSATLDVNEANGSVLPESIRRFDKESGLTWEPTGFNFGRYSATVTLTYGDPAKTLTSEVSFWIIPWMQILIALVILIILTVLIIFGIKRYNRWIVSRASKASPPPTNG